ncbi:MAG: glycosyltransferase family 4 protein [Planctomycetota bacterium]
MRILYHHRTQADDGQAVHIRSLIDAFRAEGADVREVALVEKAGGPPPGSAPAESGGGGWSWIGRVPRFVRELAEYGYTVPASRRLRGAIAEFQPSFVYERYAFGNAAGVRVASRSKVPLVLEVNSPMVQELTKTRGLSFPGFARRVESSIFQRADRIAVVTGVLRDILAELGVPAERMFVTPNGVHLELFAAPDRVAARRDLGVEAAEGPVFGFVGYYRDWHRLDLVVDALATTELRAAHLVLVGAGPVEGELREQAQRRGVAARVHFAGKRPHDRIPAVLPAFDVGLVPAINPYASPLKLHEYMAAGVAPIAPDQPNLREVLRHGHDALLVPPGDGVALVDALVRLATDEPLRQSIGAAAQRSIVEQDLTWRGNARRVLAEVRQLS